MRTYLYSLVPTSTVIAPATLYQSSAQSIEYAVNYAVESTFTGVNPGGTMSLLASNDNVNFVFIPGTSAFINGTSGNVMINQVDAAYKSIKFQFSSSAGSTGFMQSFLFTKGWQ